MQACTLVCVCVVSWLQHSLRGCVVGTLPVAVPVPLFLSLFFIMLAFSSVPSPSPALPCPRPFLLVSVCLRCSFSLRALLRHGPPTEEQGRIFHPHSCLCFYTSFLQLFFPPLLSSFLLLHIHTLPHVYPHISLSCIPPSPLILVAALDQSGTANALPVDPIFRKHTLFQTQREWCWFAALAIYRNPILTLFNRKTLPQPCTITFPSPIFLIPLTPLLSTSHPPLFSLSCSFALLTVATQHWK